ncbi:hypothetical protein PybrP1_004218 [[Pythium] brassicae (nom. inval.)]|nr:hypothetical protein PybrP1_004218 [[Pythium] brassicae (nom. inval.)]
MLALLACLALVACFALGLGALGVARVSKQRRGLKSFERSCLRALEPLALPSPSRQTQADDCEIPATFEETAGRLRRALISLAGVEHAQAAPDKPAPPPAPQAAIPRFPRLQPLVHAALRISGLSLLMANQLERALPTAVALSTDKDHGAEDFAQSSKQHTTAPQPQQLTRTRGYDSDNNDSNDDSDDSDAEQYDSESDMSDEKDAQRALFDGLQFYTVLSQVGAAAVRQAVDQALLNAHENAARERVRAQQQASIAAIEQRSMQRRLSLKRPESLAFAAEDGLEPMTRTPLTSPNTGSAQAPALEAASFLQAA